MLSCPCLPALLAASALVIASAAAQCDTATNCTSCLRQDCRWCAGGEENGVAVIPGKCLFDSCAWCQVSAGAVCIEPKSSPKLDSSACACVDAKSCSECTLATADIDGEIGENRVEKGSCTWCGGIGACRSVSNCSGATADCSKSSGSGSNNGKPDFTKHIPGDTNWPVVWLTTAAFFCLSITVFVAFYSLWLTRRAGPAGPWWVRLRRKLRPDNHRNNVSHDDALPIQAADVRFRSGAPVAGARADERTAFLLPREDYTGENIRVAVPTKSKKTGPAIDELVAPLRPAPSPEQSSGADSQVAVDH